ncbi:hypothetical protein T492DRAFT_1139902 [Pavlovales sp. CCMP2436]|nr:hypothetical protein T492DRAFT_1139902 [Pavlovales sp. CCMP2436]
MDAETSQKRPLAAATGAEPAAPEAKRSAPPLSVAAPAAAVAAEGGRALAVSDAKPTAAPAAEPPRESRKAKRKVAMIVAYSWAGYHGLQRNPNVRAVEDELVEAAAAAGFVAPALVADLQALWWCRCARTDKLLQEEF